MNEPEISVTKVVTTMFMSDGSKYITTATNVSRVEWKKEYEEPYGSYAVQAIHSVLSKARYLERFQFSALGPNLKVTQVFKEAKNKAIR